MEDLGLGLGLFQIHAQLLIDCLKEVHDHTELNERSSDMMKELICSCIKDVEDFKLLCDRISELEFDQHTELKEKTRALAEQCQKINNEFQEMYTLT